MTQVNPHKELKLPLNHQIIVKIKEPFLEPVGKPYSFLIPPDRSATFEQKYDVDYVKFAGVRRYWMDKTNIMLSPYTLDREDDATSEQIVTALGPDYTISNVDNFITDYDYLLTPGLCEVLNLYYTLLVKEKVNLLIAPSSYKREENGTTLWLEELNKHIIPHTQSSLLDILSKVTKALAGPNPVGGLMYGIKEEAILGLVEKEPIKPVDNPRANGPFISYPPEFNPITTPPSNLSPDAPVNDITFIEKLMDSFYDIAISTAKQWITDSAKNRYNQIIDNITDLKNFRDFTEDTQTIFGGTGSRCIKRKEGNPLVPFALQSKFNLMKGRPFTLKLNLNQPSQGQNGIYLRIELGAKISLMVDYSKRQITVCRRKDNLDLNYIREQEQKLDSYALMKNNGIVDENTSTLLIEDANYLTAMNNIQTLKGQVDDIKKQIEDSKDRWKQRGRASRLTPQQKEKRRQELRELNKQITDLQRDKGFRGDDDKKIRDIERRIYTQTQALQFFNQNLIDDPFQMTVIDYGCGVILFELDKEKDYDVFKDAKITSRNRKYSSTSSNMIKSLSEDTFEWLIGAPDPITKDSKIRLTGHGGVFSFAYAPISVDAKDTKSQALARIHLYSGEELFPPRGYFGGGVTNCDFHNNKLRIEKVNVGKISLYHLTKEQAKKAGNLTDINEGHASLSIPDEVKLDMSNPDEENLTITGNPFANFESKASQVVFKNPFDILFLCEKSGSHNLKSPTDYRRLESDLWSIPLMFRGYINFPAIANTKERKVIYTLVNECNPTTGISNHIVELSPTFNSGKRRVVHQIGLKFAKSSIEDDNTYGNLGEKFPKNLVGKTVDIIYDGKPLVTDGYITDEFRKDLRTIPSIIAGLFRLRHKVNTEITFNVADILRLTEDQTVDEGLILEGYAIGNGIEQLIINGGIPKEKTDIPAFGDNANSVYISNVAYPGNFIPISWPGEKLQYKCEKDSVRFEQLNRLVEDFGYEADGNRVLWVGFDGKIHFTNESLFKPVKRYIPFTIFLNRWRDGTIVYNPITRDFEQDGHVVDFYYEPITMAIDFEHYYSNMTVTGAHDPYTKERRFLSYVNPLAVADPEEYEATGDYYLGHHKRKPNEDRPYMRSNIELLRLLYYMIRQEGFPRRVLNVRVRRDVFLLPTDKVIIEDHHGNSFELKLRNIEDPNLKEDTMNLVLETLEPAIYSNKVESV